jgi:hypothetical protein
MNDRERLLAAVAGAVPGMPVDRVVALLLDPEGTGADAGAASGRLLHDLEERVKELTALHGAASFLQEDSIPAEEGLGRIAALLPPAFQFPGDCAARVVHAGGSHPTPGWTETPWRLRSAFRTSDGESGLVEVVYLKEFPVASEGPFLVEERRLLDSLAEMIATSLDRRRTEDRLRLFVGTGRIRLFDISAQKTLEIQVRETQKMEALGRLAGGIAHDFGNILGVILGYADLAARKIPESEPARKYVVEVGKAGRSGAALVQQILAFARRQELSPRRVDLRTTIGDMDGMLASLLGKRIEVRRDFASDTPGAMVDPNQFLRVVLNLCVNARDAMPEGGTITLRTRTASAGAPREDGSREDARD